jgi:SAM-dependent methyltransferase
LRETFDAATELYDRARPGYPPALFADLATLTCLGPGYRILEIGCGTGQASMPLAARGGDLVCVELGAHLAAVARRHLARFPTAQVIVAAFEDWPLPPEPFATVIAATACHWLDPAARVTKTADTLRPGGALATIPTHHIVGGTATFFDDVQACYERWDPATPPGLRLPAAATIPCDSAELDHSGRFGLAVFRRYEWECAYMTAAYRDLLLTYSGHRALAPVARRSLLACITDLIDTRYGGRITKHYLTELRVAHRRVPS